MMFVINLAYLAGGKFPSERVLPYKIPPSSPKTEKIPPRNKFYMALTKNLNRYSLCIHF